MSMGILFAMAVVLRSLGRVWWCRCGQPDLWSWHVWSVHNSQHLIDPYTFTHVLHGLLFCALLYLLLDRRFGVIRLSLGLAVEAVWEILENTNWVIERYREATISLDYFGDSIVNSLADVLACALGYALAVWLPSRLSLAGFVATEIILLTWIRDSLFLNILMLIWPIEAIKIWQMGS